MFDERNLHNLPLHVSTMSLSESQKLTNDIKIRLKSDEVEKQIEGVRSGLIFLTSARNEQLKEPAEKVEERAQGKSSGTLFLSRHEPHGTSASTYFVSSHVLHIKTNKPKSALSSATVENSTILKAHSDFAVVDMPKVLGDTICGLMESVEVKRCTLQKLENLLANPGSKRNRDVDAKYRQAFQTQLVHQSDSPSKDLLTCSSSNFIDSHSHYFSAPNSHLNSVFSSTLNIVGFEDVSQNADMKKSVGDEISVDLREFSKEMEPAIIKLEYLVEEFVSSGKKVTLGQAVKLHNTLASYTSFLLIQVSGHREANPYSFSFYTLTDEYLLLRDKDSRASSNVRILALPKIIQDQLDEYRKLCRRLSYLFSFEPKVSEQLMLFGCGENSGLLDFQLLDDKHNFYAPNYEEICKQLELNLGLPANAARHILADQMRLLQSEIPTLSESELGAEYVLGHVSAKEHPMSYFSPCSLQAIKDLAQVTEKLLIDSGLKLVSLDGINGKENKQREVSKGQPVNPFENKLSRSQRDKVYAWTSNLLIDGQYRLADVVSFQPIVKNQKNNKNEENEEVVDQRSWGVFDDELGEYIEINQEKINECIENAKEHLERERLGLSSNSKKDKIKIRENRFKQRILKGLTKRVPEKKKRLWSAGQSRFFKIKDDACLNLKLSKQLSKLLIEHIITEVKSENVNVLLVVLSLIVNTKKTVKIDESFLASLIEKWNLNSGSADFEWESATGRRRLVTDSISAALKNKLSLGQAKVKLNDLRQNYTDLLNGWKEDNALPPFIFKKIDTLDKLCRFISTSLDDQVSSYLYHYRAAYFTNRSLSSRSSNLAFKCGKRFAIETPYFQKTAVDDVFSPISYNPELIAGDLLVIEDLRKNVLEPLKHRSNAARKKLSKGIKKEEKEAKLQPFKNKAKETIKEKTDGRLLPVTVWFLSYIAHKIEVGDIGVSTALSYISTMHKPLVEIAQDAKLVNYDESKWVSLYSDALKKKETNKSVKNMSNMLQNVHKFFVKNYEAQEINWSKVEVPDVERRNILSEDIITGTEYRLILNYLDAEPNLSPRDIKYAKALLILWTRLGLRWHESFGLKRHEFDLECKLLHIKSNGARKLKTRAGNRKIPYGELLNDEEIKLLEELAQEQKTKKNLLFEFSKKYSYDNNRKELEKLAKCVVNQMRSVTGNINMSSHNCRKSFINYMICLLNFSDDTPIFKKQLKNWLGVENIDERAQILRNAITGYSYVNRNVIPSLSLMVGHEEPLTTFQSYTHIFDLMLHAHNEIVLSKNYSLEFIASLFDEPLKSNTLSQRKVARRVKKEFEIQEILDDNDFSRNHFILLKPNYEPRSYSQNEKAKDLRVELEELQKDIFKAKVQHFPAGEEQGNHKTARITDILYTISLEVGFDGAIIKKDTKVDLEQKANEWFNNIQNDTFVNYCLNSDKLEKIDFEYLCEGWFAHYNNKYKFVTSSAYVSRVNLGDFSRKTKLEGMQALIDVAKVLGLGFVVKPFSENGKKNYTVTNVYNQEVTICKFDVCLLEKPEVSQFKLFNHFVFLLVVRYMLEHYEELNIRKYHQRNQFRI